MLFGPLEPFEHASSTWQSVEQWVKHHHDRKAFAGAAINEYASHGETLLSMSIEEGNPSIVEELIKMGADVNKNDELGRINPVIKATFHVGFLANEFDVDSATLDSTILKILLECGADANSMYYSRDSTSFISAIDIAANLGNLQWVQLLSAYGAIRRPADNENGRHWNSLMEAANINDDFDMYYWLIKSDKWTPLHHVEFISANRALSLLRNGLDIHATAVDLTEVVKEGESRGICSFDTLTAIPTSGSPFLTPLSIAQDLHTQSYALNESAALLVIEAAKAWSPKTHYLFPRCARLRAVELLLIGTLLSRESRFVGCEIILTDVWMTHIMGFAVIRN